MYVLATMKLARPTRRLFSARRVLNYFWRGVGALPTNGRNVRGFRSHAGTWNLCYHTN